MAQKIYLTYEQQIEHLKNRKDLIIQNTDYAYSILQKIGYYSLISGYKNLFKPPSSEKYLYGVTFEEIVSFYYFDEQLRTIFLKYILHIEKQMKSMISYYFCDKYGEQQEKYLNINNYAVTKRNLQNVKKLISLLQKISSLPSHYSYIVHYSNNYGNVPLWVAINAMTFGQVSKLYQYLPNDIQYKISQVFPSVSERQLHQFIRVLTSCRNVCAHGERLFSFFVNETIPDTPLHFYLNIPKKNGQYLYGKHNLFGVVIALYYLLEHEEFMWFEKELNNSLHSVLKNCPHITKQKLYSQMGFPENWEDITAFV